MNRKPQDGTEQIEEEADYVNAAVRTVDKKEATSGQKFLSFTQSFLPMAACWVTLLVIMSLHIYFTSVISEKNANLTAENQNLKTQNQNLTTQNQNLKTQNQELETQKKNLTEIIQNMETKQNELNVSRAQWSINAYCPKESGVRQCKPCQKSSAIFQSGCYVFHNPGPDEQITWEEAREICKGKSSDLVVITDEMKEKFINDHWWQSSGTNVFWIGLRVEDGKWKWVDGSDLAEDSRIERPTEGHCASVFENGWRSANCSKKHQWVCEKKALSV